MIYDKRQLKRHEIFLIVEFKPLRSPGGYSIGITRDLSPDGFSLEAQTIDSQRGDIMNFRLKHPDAEWSVDISGEIIWRNHSWYKYVTGIKFLKVTEEQRTKILQLMSAVRDKPDNEIDPVEFPAAEKGKLIDATSEAATVRNLLPDPAAEKASPASLRSLEYCELTGTERTFITGEIPVISSDDIAEEIRPARNGDPSDNNLESALLNDNGSTHQSADLPVNDKVADRVIHTNSIEQADAEPEKTSATHLNTVYIQDAVHTLHSDSIDPSENNRKKKLWRYVPVAMVVAIVFAIALPVMIKKFNHDSIDSAQVLTESTNNGSVENEADIPATDNILTDRKALSNEDWTSPVKQTGMDAADLPDKKKALNSRPAPVIDNSTSIQPPGSVKAHEIKNSNTEEPAPPAEKGKTALNTLKMNNAKTLAETGTVVPTRDNVEKSGKIDLIAKIDETFKDLRAIKIDEPIETEAFTETEKTPADKPLVKAEERPVTPQVVKHEEIPAIAAIQESEPSVTHKQEVNIPGENKSQIKKTGPSVNRPEMPSVALLVKRDKSRRSTNNSSPAQGGTSSDLLKTWKHIGNTKSGVPLFIAPENTSYPYEHVVNLLVKASVNKKDFIDLLAINCSQIKLRILEERNGNNPAFSSYSSEWKEINPDNMILYNSACPEKK
ncbi:MAG: PilZ domain-containing protein [Nitrospiraceae bacterium]|nr:MAG: PilZ domain-containing protein [Nitrospiraceae bacterium]